MDVPLILIVRLWINGTDIAAFEAFERKAALLLARHGGTIEHVYRSASVTYALPFETHIVGFPNREYFTAYRNDPEVQAFAAKRETVIARTEIQEVVEAPAY